MIEKKKSDVLVISFDLNGTDKTIEKQILIERNPVALADIFNSALNSSPDAKSYQNFDRLKVNIINSKTPIPEMSFDLLRAKQTYPELGKMTVTKENEGKMFEKFNKDSFYIINVNPFFGEIIIGFDSTDMKSATHVYNVVFPESVSVIKTINKK